MVFFFEFVYMVDYIDGFPYIKPSLHPRDEAYLIMVNDHFDVFLDSLCKDFVEYFCINVCGALLDQRGKTTTTTGFFSDHALLWECLD